MALKLPVWLAPLAIVVLIAGVVGYNHWRSLAAPAETVLACADLRAGCAAPHLGAKARIGVDGELRLLQPFELWVRLDAATKVQASFTMAGMDMGFNLYTLRPDGRGNYRTRVILPMCVTGRHDWRLHVDIDGARTTLSFVTGM